MRRQSFLLSAASLVSGMALILLLQLVAKPNSKSTPTPSLKMAFSFSQDPESYAKEEQRGILEEFQQGDNWFEDLQRINRAGQQQPKRAGRKEANEYVIPGFMQAAAGPTATGGVRKHPTKTPREDAAEKRMIEESTKGRVRTGPIMGCEQFRSANFSWPKDMRTIAIVGNGPLTEESRRQINKMDLVIRFNKLQSYRCGEKMDVWASRHGDAVTTRYWGIVLRRGILTGDSNVLLKAVSRSSIALLIETFLHLFELQPITYKNMLSAINCLLRAGQKLGIAGCSFQDLLNAAGHIWLMNGGDGPFNHFLNFYPQIKARQNYIWLDCRNWVVAYMRRHDPKLKMGIGASSPDEVSPSSGWLVLMMVKDCAPPGAELHLFGFNWPGGQWPAHKVEAEKKEIERLALRGKLYVHQTQCAHKYHCSAPA